MKKPLSLLMVIGLIAYGWIIGIQNKPIVPLPTQSVTAQVPLDLRLGQVRTIRDTVWMQGDTVFIPSKPVVVTKIKKVSVPYKITKTDTLCVPALVLITQTDRTPTVAEQPESIVDSVPARNVTGQTE